MDDIKKRKAFNFYSSYDEAFEVLSDKHQIKLFKAIRDVQFFRVNINDIDFKETELKFAWLVIKHSIENQVMGYCRANKVRYEDTLKDTPKVSSQQEEVQVQEEVQEEVEYTIAETEKPLSHRTIDYLNLKAGKRFKYGKSNLKEIEAQIKKGVSETELAHVINVKCAEWLNTDMDKHLNPVTLFRESKFDKYLNQRLVLTEKQKLDAYFEAQDKGVI